ncbi:MAG TPA: long-chain fatty acid--CoA ligase [Anaerolineales bacterium]
MVMEKAWLKFYEPHVPEHIDYPRTVMPEVLRSTAQKYPDRTAIIFKGARITYQTLDKLVDRFTAALQSIGVQKGSRVAIFLPNCPQYIIAYYGVLRAGAIVVPCNPLYQAQEMTHQLNDSGAEVLVTLSSTYPLIKRIRPETRLRRVVVAEIKTYFPPAIKLLFTVFMEKKMGHRVSIAGDENTDWFTEFLQKGQSAPMPVPVSWEDTAVFMYTGGTTGISKGAQLTHKNILANAYQCKAWLNSPEAQDCMLTQVPLFHCYGMTICMNLSVLNAMTMLLIPDPRDLEDVIKTIDRCHPTLYPGVPAMYNAINNYSHLARYDLSSIRACISGAAGLPVEVQQNFQKITGARVVEGYGLSEASPVTHGNPVFGDNRIGTIGLPWPDTEVRITDVDTGERELGVGEVGELCVRGPQVMKGYWNMPIETANALRPDPLGGEPWLYTGDIAMMDEDGYFRIVDRKKDMILGSGGYNIYPREIEDVLYTYPKVLEAAAVGIPVEGKGERIKVYVVLKPGETATDQEIIDFCRANAGSYIGPRGSRLLREPPRRISRTGTSQDR